MASLRSLTWALLASAIVAAPTTATTTTATSAALPATGSSPKTTMVDIPMAYDELSDSAPEGTSVGVVAQETLKYENPPQNTIAAAPAVVPNCAPVPASNGVKSACHYEDIPNCKPCKGQPSKDRDRWCGFDINTDWTYNTPLTCRRAVCRLEITRSTVSPDGLARPAIVANGQLPGPLLEAHWGDEVRVTVVNKLSDNGTSIHFHGQRQLDSPFQDGTASITQCPIKGDGGEYTHVFRAQNYGTGWWHSHYSLQSWDGLSGPMTVHGPASAPYDIDMGPVVLQDWMHIAPTELFDMVQRTGQPRQDNILVNGHARFTGSTDGGAARVTGMQANFTLTPNKTHRLRLINTAMDTIMSVSLDGHEMTVIAADYVPVKPFKVKALTIGEAQRYDVLITANQSPGSYWFRVEPLSAYPSAGPACTSTNNNVGETMALFHYKNACITTQPTTTPWPVTPSCGDIDYSQIQPVVRIDAKAPKVSIHDSVSIAQDNTTKIYRWQLSGTTFQGNYSLPSLLSSTGLLALEGSASTSPLSYTLPNKNEWVQFLIEATNPVPHPIHLHGHDFQVLGAGPGTYTGQALRTSNPVRRDTAMLPGSGWLMLRWKTDNPGVWLAHCHVGWHITMGFGLQFVELADRVDTKCERGQTAICRQWDAWLSKAHVRLEVDSQV